MAYNLFKLRRTYLLLAILFVIFILFILFSSKADAENSREVYTYYTSYEIQTGDTLWTIADNYIGPDFTDKKEFISEVKKLNHLTSDNITAGNYLVIRYSSYERL